MNRIESEVQIKARPAFILNKTTKYNKLIFKIMVPITRNEYDLILVQFHDKEAEFVNIKDDIDINKKALKLFGSTDDIPEDVARELAIESIWNWCYKDKQTLSVIMQDKQPTIMQYYDPVEIVEVGIAKLGNPELIAAFEIDSERYFRTKFFNTKVKPAYGL